MSTVLITGAAGNLGRKVTAALAAPGSSIDQVLAVDRVPIPGPPPGVEAHSLELAAPGAQDDLAALGKRASVVVHLAWQPEGKHNLAALQNVLDAAEAIEPSQLLHLSSATVYGAWADNPVPLTEEMLPRPNPELPYAVEKLAAETLVKRWADEHGTTQVAVLRPACTVGAPGHHVYAALASCKRPPIGAEGRMVQYLHLDDLASAAVHAIERELCGIFNVAPDGGIQDDVAGALVGGPAMLPLPRRLRLLLDPLLSAELRRSKKGVQPYLEHTWVISPDKLLLAGWRPEYSSEQAIVVSDNRSHWDELPQARRAQITVAGAAAALVAAGAGGAALWRRRR